MSATNSFQSHTEGGNPFGWLFSQSQEFPSTCSLISTLLHLEGSLLQTSRILSCLVPCPVNSSCPGLPGLSATGHLCAPPHCITKGLFTAALFTQYTMSSYQEKRYTKRLKTQFEEIEPSSEPDMAGMLELSEEEFTTWRGSQPSRRTSGWGRSNENIWDVASWVVTHAERPRFPGDRKSVV